MPFTHAPCRRRTLLLVLASDCAPALALEPAQHKVVLSLTGKLAHRNTADGADFDMAQLAALPQHSFTTHTPWDTAARKFTGPLLRDVLSAAGAQGDMLEAMALNDYKVQIPVADARLFNVIIALAMDDQPMRVRDRGPLFIIYPFDSDARLRSDVYYLRSAWQLRRLDVQ